ncbi:MAG TPA: hypothetical protein DEB17_09705 [Chlorobaculum sp.]|uniref:Uncharacterized protein n=1 Tax=Chlorobaculum tepidum (strain ATCC 49652 / DSM 12025 / NBRC 103806 / TLS) TaxID=194439 RepID=Q8KA95_CHLTE|nr:hypothetical protein CT2272 [Chlorobaculum tepidum TLS]HBU24243.1 hypothetical protein [Chlorobaculum sp.]
MSVCDDRGLHIDMVSLFFQAKNSHFGRIFLKPLLYFKLRIFCRVSANAFAAYRYAVSYNFAE